MYTRGGDRGETSLYGSRRVKKDTPLVEAYGSIDELNSFIGVAASGCKRRAISRDLEWVQRMLFVAGADAANPARGRNEPVRIRAADTRRLEEMTDILIARLPRLRNFILPGGSRTASEIHAARAVCRRVERRLVAASNAEWVNPELIPFFNRLSTYLFNLARSANASDGRKDRIWRAESI